ncbi:MAG: hypothetical protein A2086_07325 [Spirochaetes bacterium GWD1_27_9]|nr:MAG: hypothetical protein A2Z98_07500 [Spirochaetes bacterium GWB1_27_13]OHD20379.1 MAG: hypothetical protein A2Y34_07875 [Spirochaetes bacterium GWC1_27_15]OHD29104.1 MAG: hypothetical protein A2086_07325 [Spirochaetes bacterium GWD1_27_9]
MRLIDIDRLKIIDNHIHYIKEYEGSVVLMDKMAKIIRNDIKFSLEYKPMGDPEVKVSFVEPPDFNADHLIPKIKEKIFKLDREGTLSNLHKK